MVLRGTRDPGLWCPTPRGTGHLGDGRRALRSGGDTSPRCYVAPNPQPNAFAVGRTPRHAAIVVTEGLLSLLEPPEIRAVIAHELIHIRRRDTLATSMAGATTSRMVAGAERVQRACPRRKGVTKEDPGVVMTSATNLAARLLRFALSSDRETRRRSRRIGPHQGPRGNGPSFDADPTIRGRGSDGDGSRSCLHLGGQSPWRQAWACLALFH